MVAQQKRDHQVQEQQTVTSDQFSGGAGRSQVAKYSWLCPTIGS